MSEPKEVSEKTLELNLCAEILKYVRPRPGNQKALWIGLTQKQEKLQGLDARIRNFGSGFFSMFQFKAPWATSIVDDLYKFSINERQHQALEKLASRYPRDVCYVFPFYSTWTKADNHAPNLLQDTWLVPVSSIPLSSLTSASNPPKGYHRVELMRDGSQITVTVYSPEVIGSAINAQEYFAERREIPSLDEDPMGIPSDQLNEWWDRVDHDNLSIRFRGLNALVTYRSGQ